MCTFPLNIIPFIIKLRLFLMMYDILTVIDNVQSVAMECDDV